METEAETGGRRPAAQGRTPGAPGSWKRREGPSPGASAGTKPWDPLTSDIWTPKTEGTRMNICCFEPPILR